MSFTVVAIVGLGIMVAAGVTNLIIASSGKKKRIAEQKKAKAEMNKNMRRYKNLDTSNLQAGVRNKYLDMENVYEDMTVNQQQAQFEAEQNQQQQANIMQGMQGAAGSSGIAALAQTMANQGQLAAQRASASIGMQEQRIEQLKAGEASRLQLQERAGEQQAEAQRLQGAETARGLEWQKTGTLLGMSHQRTAAANKARADAKAQQMAAVGQIGEAGGTAAGMGGAPKKGDPNTAVPVDQGKMRESYGNQMDMASQNARSNQAMRQDAGVYDTAKMNNASNITGKQKVFDEESGTFVWR